MYRRNRHFCSAVLLLSAFGLSAMMVVPGAHATARASILACGWDTSAGWVHRENIKEGDPRWADGIPIEYSGDFRIRPRFFGIFRRPARFLGAKNIAGWFDSPSGTCGNHVGLHLSGNSAPVFIKVYRMGYYGGAGARLVATDRTAAIPQYPLPEISPAPQSTVSTKWPVAWNFTITHETPPGQYLIRLDDSGGHASFVPLTVFDAKIKSSITLVSSVLTWQAYNHWGGYSLYKGPNESRATRSNVVSFNRPYGGDGAGQFRYLEYPILKLAEKLGIDMNYITDIELGKNIESLNNTDSILLGGHSEYWTNAMRDALQAAVNRGVNLVSLGGNAGYNRTRLQSGNRQIAMWRSRTTDPFGNDPKLATMAWRDSPIRKPESLLLGAQYVGLGANGDYSVAHPNRWPFSAMKRPVVLRGIVGREVDSALYAVGPAVEVLAWSAIQLQGKAVTTMATYYTNSMGAGVLDIATNGWVCAIDNVCPWHPKHFRQTQKDVRLVTEEILKGLAKGPLGKWHPAITDVPARTKISVLHSPI